MNEYVYYLKYETNRDEEKYLLYKYKKLKMWKNK